MKKQEKTITSYRINTNTLNELDTIIYEKNIENRINKKQMTNKTQEIEKALNKYIYAYYTNKEKENKEI